MLTVSIYATLHAKSIPPSCRMTRRVSRPYHHGDLRATLVTTALALVDEVGIDGFSLREVSRRAGVSHAAAYNHFEDKSALVAAIVHASFGRLREALVRAERRSALPIARLEHIGVAYITFACSNPTEFRLMFRPELYAKNENVRSLGPSVETDAYAVLERTVQAAVVSGAIVDCDAATVALAAWSLVHGFATLVIDGPNADLRTSARARNALARRVVGLVAQGFAARGK